MFFIKYEKCTKPVSSCSDDTAVIKIVINSYNLFVFCISPHCNPYIKSKWEVLYIEALHDSATRFGDPI